MPSAAGVIAGKMLRCRCGWLRIYERSHLSAAKGSLTIAIPSGSVVQAIGTLAGNPTIDFSKVFVFFCNERQVSIGGAADAGGRRSHQYCGSVPHGRGQPALLCTHPPSPFISLKMTLLFYHSV